MNAPKWTTPTSFGGTVNARRDTVREVVERLAFDRWLDALPKDPCGCSSLSRCNGAHARKTVSS